VHRIYTWLGIKGVILRKFRALGRSKSKEGNLERCMQRVHIFRKEWVTNCFDSEAQEEERREIFKGGVL
jgi:hypothetical protein